MQGEESNVGKDIKGLNDVTCHVLSSFTNFSGIADLYAASDNLSSTFAAVEHEQLSLKETLKDLLRVEEEELATLDDVRAETLGAGITQQLSQLSQANRKKTGLDEDIDSLKRSIQSSQLMEQELEQRVKSSNQHIMTALPKINASNQTYIQISRLKWDYTAPENVVKGFVVHPKKRDVTPFKLDKSSHSQFFITNFLWEQIGADSTF